MNTALIVIVLFAVAAGLFYLSQNQNSESKMNPADFKELYEEKGGIIIDVRTDREYASGHLKKTDHNFDVTSGEFQKKLDSLDKNKTYFLYCRSGNRSSKAAGIMKHKGFEKVYNVGGYQSLVNAGFEKE